MEKFTTSALVDILADSFAICRTKEFHGCGSYYYNEIKLSKLENRPIKVLQKSLNVLDGKIDNYSIKEKGNLITRALNNFTYRNIPSSDAKGYCKNMRWLIVKL